MRVRSLIGLVLATALTASCHSEGPRTPNKFVASFTAGVPQLSLLGIGPGAIGGTPDNWQLLEVRPRLTLLNTPRAKADLAGALEWVAGDGRALPFRDRAFDVVFSNSVIEHVGDAASQERFAKEVARVGRAGHRLLSRLGTGDRESMRIYPSLRDAKPCH